MKESLKRVLSQRGMSLYFSAISIFFSIEKLPSVNQLIFPLVFHNKLEENHFPSF